MGSKDVTCACGCAGEARAVGLSEYEDGLR
jgi:hypothetical protein